MVDSSQNCAHIENSNNPSQSSNRLLWRGSIINQAGMRLHGLAIVAHAINPKGFSKIRDDPFSADSGLKTLSDTCLELEMLRGRDLHVDRVSQLTLEPAPRDDQPAQGVQIGSRKSRVASLLKGKDPDSSDSSRGIPFSEIECDPEVRLYVDPRCSQTHRWILSQIGKRELSTGDFTRDALILTLDHTIDDRISQQLVIFGRRVEEASVQPSSSTTPVPLQLVIGLHRPQLSRRIPRPDDPMPRAPPVMLFGDPAKAGTKKSAGTVPSKSKRQAGSAVDQSTSSPFLAEPTSSKVRSTYLPKPKPNSFITNLKNTQKRNLKVIKKPANTPGRRAKQDFSGSDNESDVQNSQEASETMSPRRAGKRKSGQATSNSNSAKKMKIINQTLSYGDQCLDVCAPIDEEGDEDDTIAENSFGAIINRSPSPSPASFRCKTMTHIPTPETLDSPFEYMNQPDHSSYALIDSTNQKTGSNNPKARALKENPKSRNLAGPKEPPETEHASKSKSDTSSPYLTQNKLLIRKFTSESLSNRGLHKQHPKFKDLYGAVCRGVQFAMREALEIREIDKNLTKSFVESHLAMYMILN
ncbi:hypothetical protein Pst134EA_009145 [Puccinia striiformis f. sp. tritici]|uniref:hypothetical protein n=1 Tax=Puccinia striiformis f. sp. tritici TaxID=168172 RepID=UPI0020086E13|nr:hypothetical protein Pst134EA_009145 [Puccinia striiformis f. sp. tritici]KAH9468609.1 hypothetical protein Pst134EA_009145 [Puccinia striiformis f. sp. tritici]